jgi:hypothetical protein
VWASSSRTAGLTVLVCKLARSFSETRSHREHTIWKALLFQTSPCTNDTGARAARYGQCCADFAARFAQYWPVLPKEDDVKTRSMASFATFVLLTGGLSLLGCSDDDDSSDDDNSAGMGGSGGGSGGTGGGPANARIFTVTIENVAAVRPFTSGGAFTTPVGDLEPGPATPGKAYEFTVNAGRTQRLSFATMLAATNDLFYGPMGEGIALHAEDGTPISGDVTDQVYLWDAGTEVNEEPRVGPNTVTNQAGPDTGPEENGEVVAIEDVTEDTFAYPTVAQVVAVTVTHVEGTEFRIRIENVSSNDALMTSAGNFPAPISPGVWVVHNQPDPLYTVGMPDRGHGIESIAEDGAPELLGAFVADNAGVTFPASPGVWVVHQQGTKPLFAESEPDYGDGLEAIAEDGNPAMLGASIAGLEPVRDGAVFNMPVGGDSAGPILPGSSYRFSFEASPGDALSFVTMLAATNDVFFAPTDAGLSLFDADGMPLEGEITAEIRLWDVGTELNEEPAIGPGTVTNQLAPDTGEDENEPVQLLSDVADGFSYPEVNEVLSVTIESE